MICDTNTKSSEKHLPSRNTQLSRYSLLKKQREQILQLRQVLLLLLLLLFCSFFYI